MTVAATATRPSWGTLLRRGLADVWAGFSNYEIWSSLAWQEIRQRYRRSLLGPFWITLTMLVTIGGMGPLYSILFKLDPTNFLPYLALGIITWGLISPLILEGCTTFVESDRLIRSVKLPLSTYVAKTVYSNLLIFLHNILAFVPIMLFFGIAPHWRWLMAIPGVMLITVAAVPAGFILGIFCARFRDLQPIVSSVVQLAFFMTPIFWKASLLGPREYLVNFNPLYLFIEMVRGPIYGYIPGIKTYIGVGLVIVVLYAAALPLFSRYRSRIAFWV
ncbi:ABC transporter permease [Oleiagrimonas sp. C23AA]|nr:ABC transporter permease [Oleiagrimonas sp. C23AA]